MPDYDKEIYFERCQVIPEHAMQIMNWRNNPETLSMSFHQEAKVWQNFWTEYRDTYFIEPFSLYPVFAISDGKKIGFLKFKRTEHPQGKAGVTIDFSINIAPEIRGKGMGKCIIKQSLIYLSRNGVHSVYAEVLSKNIRSIKTFESAGFELFGVRDKLIPDTGETYEINQFLIDIQSPFK